MTSNENNTKKAARLVFNSGVARALLRAGATIIDLKPDRDNKSTGRDKTIFVFKNDAIFEAAFEKINNEIAESKKGVEAEEE